MVAVRMVSEGVDVPRLAVGVYATTTATPLFFAQAVGRFVRARKRGETASVFLPSVPDAARLRLRDGGRARPRARPRRSPTRATSSPPRTTCSPRPRPGRVPPTSWTAAVRGAGLAGALRPGALRRRRVRPLGRGARRLGGGDGLPRHPRPARARPGARPAALAAEPSGPRSRSRRRRARTTTVAEVCTHEQLAVLRRELNGLVAAWFHRTGQPHGVTHAALRKECGGPAAAVATAEQLRARIDAHPRLGGPQELQGSSAPIAPRLGDMAAETSQTLDRGLRVLSVLAAPRRPHGHRARLAPRGQPHRGLPAGRDAGAARPGAPRRRRAGCTSASAVLHLAAAVQPVLRDLAVPVLRQLAETVGGDRAPQRGRRRRGPGPGGGRAVLDRLPRRLPRRRRAIPWTRAPRARRSCSAGSPAPQGLRGDPRASCSPGRTAWPRPCGGSRAWTPPSAS